MLKENNIYTLEKKKINKRKKKQPGKTGFHPEQNRIYKSTY